MTKVWAIVLTSLFFFLSACQAAEDNDLWLLLSSYEDIGITVNDLAFFLVTHGFDAQPERSYVAVEFSDGKEVYVTPNGAASRLGDLWMTLPANQEEPVQVITGGAIKMNATYRKTENPNFMKIISRSLAFPVAPLGMCFDGSQKLQENYRSLGYSSTYMYDPSGYDGQGHLWVVVEDKENRDTWMAVDSYYGAMIDDGYYTAQYSFADFKYLDSINPKWKLN